MYPSLVPLILFCFVAAFTPGPNNILGSYSGFNFGIKKSILLNNFLFHNFYLVLNLVVPKF